MTETIVEIAAGALSARLLPERGGRVARLDHLTLGALLRPLDESEAFDPLAWPKAGAYPLIPFHGRIEGARFPWDGRDVRLTPHPAEPGHALHGPAHRRAWTVAEAGEARAVLRLDHGGDADWPFAFAAEQVFELTATGLAVTLTLTDPGEGAMPAGIGWHPYFPKALSISHDARRHWPRRPGTTLPSGEVTAPPAEIADRTTFLSDWTSVTLEVVDANLTLTGDAVLDHLVLHDDAPGHTCVEPVSEPANAVNLPDPAMLAPGETMRGRVVLSIEAGG